MRRDPRGLRGPTKGQAEGPDWRRTSRGLYVPAGVDRGTPEQRIVEAAAVLPSYGGVTGWAALRWCGGRWFSGLTAGGRREAPVWLATGRCDVRRQPGIEISAERLKPGDFAAYDGLRITTAVRAVCFEMRYATNLLAAVTALDMAAYNDLVSIDEVAAYADELNGWTGIPLCREAIPYADENSWSPREVDMRISWTEDAGLPRPLCNVPIFDRYGAFVGTPDLLDPVAGVVGEYDGALHLEGTQRHRDEVRAGIFRAHGLEYVTMLSGDLPDRSGFLRRLCQAYGRAAHQAPSRRSWTIDRPSWWTDSRTVEARRALEGPLRERLLRHRRLPRAPDSP